MTKRSLVCAFLFLFPLLVQAEDRYVALSTGLDLWVLKINTEGKVLEAHRQHLDYFAASVGITPVSTSAGPALAVFKAENAVDVTIIESALFQRNAFSEFHNFGGRVLSEAGVLQVTQKPAANWLLAKARFHGLYQGFGFNLNLESNGKIKTVSPAIPGAIGPASVSSDGRMLTEGATTPADVFELINQPLTADGNKTGRPVVIPTPEGVSGVDCSNPLRDGSRNIIYRTSRVEGIDTITSQMFLQKVHAATGIPMQPSRILAFPASRVVTLGDLPQAIAIDPLSQFVLYTAVGECGKKVLKFQGIDPGGIVVFAPKVIFGCGRIADTQAGIESMDVSLVNVAPAP